MGMEGENVFENVLDLENFQTGDGELSDLRQFLDSREDFKNVPRDEKFLEKFLRAKSHDMIKVKEMISRYCTARSKFKENFRDSLPSASRETFNHQVQTVLLHRDTQ